LTLLYPNLRYSQVNFHQDHIFPVDIFKDSNLKKENIPEINAKTYKEIMNQLPNLQLMECSENKEKSKKHFSLWVSEKYPDEDERNNYLRANYIPANQYQDFTKFIEFIEARKLNLKKKLKEVL
jgi:hypothetical protein